jgi:hypothetical protein
MHFLGMWLNLSVQSTNKSFEMPENLGQYSHEDFFGLFWGEQQPFVSSGYGGLYFFGGHLSRLTPWSAASLARPALVGRGSLMANDVNEAAGVSGPTFCYAKTRAEPRVFSTAAN